MINISLAGKTAIVTGGGQGLGAEICRTLRKADANVVINYFKDDKGINQQRQICAVPAFEDRGGGAAGFAKPVSKRWRAPGSGCCAGYSIYGGGSGVSRFPTMSSLSSIRNSRNGNRKRPGGMTIFLGAKRP